MPFPSGFTFGVAIGRFEVEGGDFWNRFEEHLDGVAGIGCDAVRLPVDWARVEPVEGDIDEAALDRYGAILDACHDHRLQPVVTLHDITQPAWLGADFWTHPDAPERFAAWVDVAVGRLAGRCRHWVTINRPNVLAIQSYLRGRLPPSRRRDVAGTVRTLDHMLTAHVLAYEVIKQRQTQAAVTINPSAHPLYELDLLLTDVLLARSRSVGRHDLREHLQERRTAEYRAHGRATTAQRALRRLSGSAIPLEQALPRAASAAFSTAHERCLDVVAVDFDAVDPVGLTQLIQRRAEPGLDLWVLGNGLRTAAGEGWDGPRYLRAHVAAIRVAAERGAPVTAYFHWMPAGDDVAGAYRDLIGAARVN